MSLSPKVFTTPAEYIDFLTALPIVEGEVFCYSFVPVAFFPKDAIFRLYERADPTDDPRKISDLLWAYAQTTLRAFYAQKISIIIEEKAWKALIEHSLIHDGIPQFEVTSPVVDYVLQKACIKGPCSSLSLTPAHMPFIFRLHPPAGVLIDVRTNVNAQHVQGLWINDREAFLAFSAEAARLREGALTGGALQAEVRRTLDDFRRYGVLHWRKKIKT